MTDCLLTLNAGSSSLKFALYEAQAVADAPPSSFATARLVGQVERLGTSEAQLRINDAHGVALFTASVAADHGLQIALDALLAWLSTQSTVRVVACGHRVVHGGTQWTAPVCVDQAVLAQLAALTPLAPLHQPHNLAGIAAAQRAFPTALQVACFDTAFHHTQSLLNRRFALPQALHDAGVQRYGFHGLSYESIVAQLQSREPAFASDKVVVAHLGNGTSLCAIANGQSVATTMSFSPLDGLPMGTRCGRLDPAVVLHLLAQPGATLDSVTHLLTRESGLLGLSGLSSDLRALEASSLPAAREAIDYFVEYVARDIASMAAALRGIDALVFTGGIGENAALIRERIVQEARWLGFFTVHVLRTNEEGIIAAHTASQWSTRKV